MAGTISFCPFVVVKDNFQAPTKTVRCRPVWILVFYQESSNSSPWSLQRKLWLQTLFNAVAYLCEKDIGILLVLTFTAILHGSVLRSSALNGSAMPCGECAVDAFVGQITQCCCSALSTSFGLPLLFQAPIFQYFMQLILNIFFFKRKELNIANNVPKFP